MSNELVDAHYLGRLVIVLDPPRRDAVIRIIWQCRAEVAARFVVAGVLLALYLLCAVRF